MCKLPTMAFVVRGKGSRWELRQARHTARGPRSVTLATFECLTPDVFAHARGRAVAPLDEAGIVAAARRAGAPVLVSPGDDDARRLLRQLARGSTVRPALARLLVDALAVTEGVSGGGEAVSSAARAAGQWVGASAHERAEALVDLLLLADALPQPAELDRRPRFPRLTPVG